MYLITIILKSAPHVLQFHFDHFKDAEKTLVPPDISGPALSIQDAYGSKAYVVHSEIAGIFLTNLDKEMEAQEKVELAKMNKDFKLRKKLAENSTSRLMVPGGGVA